MSNGTGQSTTSARILLLVFGALAVLTAALGYLYCDYTRARFESDAERSLGAIADLKAGQIRRWRRERLADAYSTMANRPGLDALAVSLSGNGRLQMMCRRGWTRSVGSMATSRPSSLVRRDGQDWSSDTTTHA